MHKHRWSTCISNHLYDYVLWDVITHPCHKFNGGYTKVRAWMSLNGFYFGVGAAQEASGPWGICKKSSPLCAAYVRQWIGSVLVQIMACRLFGAKPLPKPMLGYCRLDPYEQTSVKFHQTTKLFIHKNACENIVCEMASILSRGDELNERLNLRILRKTVSTRITLISADFWLNFINTLHFNTEFVNQGVGKIMK